MSEVSKSESEWSEVTLFWFFIFLETYICYRKYFDLNFHIGNKVQEKFSYGSKNLVKLGVRKKKHTAGRTVFNFLCKTSGFALVFALFEYIDLLPIWFLL